MKNKLFNIFLFIFSLGFISSNFLFIPPAFGAIELVKSKDFGTVYYLDSNGIRHPFPNETTYQSWYSNDFSKVVTVNNDFLKNYPLGKNITIRPGTYLVKIRTAPQVYAVEQGGVLREIKDESIAETIYGKDWNKRVVDIPDVFFSDYIIGDSISHDYTIPDSILYQDKITGKYYYKNNGILRLFDSADALAKNNFRKSFTLTSSRSYFIRGRPISGLDKNVFNPVAAPIVDSRDCENKKLKAAVILAGDKDYNNDQITRLQKIKKEISERFSWATDGLSFLDVDYPTTILLDDGYLLQKRNDGTTEVKNELINTFYDNHPDIFDFIIIWTNFKIPKENTNEIAHFIPVTNRQEGLNLAILDRSEIYGSTGKLKGLIMMGNIEKYHPETTSGLNEVLDYVLHEILHQWSAYIEIVDEGGQKNKALLREPDFGHWNYYAGFISPVGGAGWIDQGDSTFVSQLSQMTDSSVRKYSQLDLYLMGLIPYQLFKPIFYVEPKEKGVLGNTIFGTAKWVTADQIIKANGKVQCSLD